MVKQSRMKLRNNSDIIKLNYSIYPDGEETLISMYFNDKGGIINDGEEAKILAKMSLSKLDKSLLEKRSLSARLSIGYFKLHSDHVENIENDLGAHCLIYKRI